MLFAFPTSSRQLEERDPWRAAGFGLQGFSDVRSIRGLLASCCCALAMAQIIGVDIFKVLNYTWFYLSWPHLRLYLSIFSPFPFYRQLVSANSRPVDRGWGVWGGGRGWEGSVPVPDSDMAKRLAKTPDVIQSFLNKTWKIDGLNQETSQSEQRVQ